MKYRQKIPIIFADKTRPQSCPKNSSMLLQSMRNNKGKNKQERKEEDIGVFNNQVCENKTMGCLWKLLHMG